MSKKISFILVSVETNLQTSSFCCIVVVEYCIKSCYWQGLWMEE